MRTVYTDFLATLATRTEEDSAFFRGLVSETTTLHALFTVGPHARRKIGADWLDYSVVRDRVSSALA